MDEQNDGMNPVLIGYLPKRTARRPDWLAVPHVQEICSASCCISKGPRPWVVDDQLNDASLYDDEAMAWSGVPEGSRADFHLYAFGLFPIIFNSDGESRLMLPKLAVEPIPIEVQSLGYDAVSNSGWSGRDDLPPDAIWFECSPLSCNSMAEKIAVNEYCLMNSRREAFRAANQFAQGGVEPGPYLVVEVFRSLRLQPPTR